jgi:hypothetical protein
LASRLQLHCLIDRLFGVWFHICGPAK